MNCSTPGLPVYYQLPEFTQTHAYQVGDAIQPSHPLSSPSPPDPNPSQHQGLFNCSRLLFPFPGDLPDPGIKPPSPELQADSLLLGYQGSLGILTRT